MTNFLRFLNFIRFSRSKCIPGRRPQSVGLAVETLEDRMLPSTSSPVLHAVMSSSGSTAFFRGSADNAFYEKTSAGPVQQLSGANSIKDFSAGLERDGLADVFARDSYGSMVDWSWISTSDHVYFSEQHLNEPKPMYEFAAVSGGRCYAVATDHSLWEYTIPYTVTGHIYISGHLTTVNTTVGGWQQLWGANAVWALDAVTQKSGVDAVFVTGGDGRLEEFTQSTWSTLYAGHNPDDDQALYQFSAGLESNGNADVFMLTWGGDLDQWVTGGWRTVAQDYPPVDSGWLTSSYNSISATSNGQVFVLSTTTGIFGDFQTLVEFNPDLSTVAVIANFDHVAINNQNFSAAGADDVFWIADGHLQEYSGAFNKIFTYN